MDVDMKEVTCSEQATQFVVFADGQAYIFLVPNELIYPYLNQGEKVDCPQFVIECQEIFEELAANEISKGCKSPFVIDRDLLTTYFQ